jgi:BASS family bile acid:Na+ symporter
MGLTIFLTALLTAGTIVFMPLMLPVLLPGFGATPLTIARPLILLILLPLCIAMLARWRAPRLSAACRPALNAVANVSLAVLLVLLIGLNTKALLGVVGSGAILVSAIFVALVFVAGYSLGGAEPQAKGVLGLASASRNVGAALPAASVQPDPKVVVMLLVGTLVGLLLCLVAAASLRQRAAARLGIAADLRVLRN